MTKLLQTNLYLSFLSALYLFCHRSAYGVIACQLVNQGINAIINYTNRNPMSDDPEDISMIHQAFALATTASCAAALGFRSILASRGTLFEVSELISILLSIASYYLT